MKVYVDRDEWWPYYILDKDEPSYSGFRPVDMPQELFERYQAAAKEFEEASGLVGAVVRGEEA